MHRLKFNLSTSNGALIFNIRQSSMRQVVENVESTKRQYALRGRATALGWRDDQIITIDSDQGEFWRIGVWREGFQRLVTDVGMGRAGIVMAWRCLAWQETMLTGIASWRSVPLLIRSFSMRMVCTIGHVDALSVCSWGDNEMVPHARFELHGERLCSLWYWETGTFVMRIALHADDAVAEAPLDPRGRTCRHLRDIGNGQPSGDVARTIDLASCIHDAAAG